jgi:hypothetical protein
MGWGDVVDSPPDTDTGAIERDEVSVTFLSRLDHEARDDLGLLDAAVDELLGR